MTPTPALEVLPHAESMVRCPGHRLLAAPMQDKKRSRLLAAVGLESPSSATLKAALELWNDEATRLLLRLVGRDIPPRHLSRIRLSAADWATEKESARMTPATGSTA